MRVILTLLAALALSPAAARDWLQQPMPEEEREKTRIRIGITREQQTQIEAIYAEANKQECALRDRMGELYRQLYAVYEDYEFDRNQARALRREITKLYVRRMDLHAETQERLRRVLNREQFARLSAVIREQHERFRKQWEERRRGKDHTRLQGMKRAVPLEPIGPCLL